MESVSEDRLARMLGSKFGEVTRAGGGNGTELIVDCPFCGRHKLSVNAQKGVWQCWHCHESGTTRRLLGKAVKAVRAERVERPRSSGYIPPGDLVPLDALNEDSEAWLYLKGRGFDPVSLCRNFGVSYCRKGRSFAGGVFNTSGTVVLPVCENGKSVAWQSRLLYDPSKVKADEMAAYGFVKDEKGRFKVPPKYFTMPGFRKGEHLFNFDQASGFGFTVVTEGAFDAMRVGRCAVAAFGKGVTDMQVQILRGCWPVVVLLLDPDAEDDQELLRRRIEGAGVFGGGGSSGTKVVSVRLSGYKDAGEAPQREVVRQIVLAARADGVDLGRLSAEDPFRLK